MSRLLLHMRLIRCWDAAMSYAPRLRWARRTGGGESKQWARPLPLTFRQAYCLVLLGDVIEDTSIPHPELRDDLKWFPARVGISNGPLGCRRGVDDAWHAEQHLLGGATAYRARN